MPVLHMRISVNFFNFKLSYYSIAVECMVVGIACCFWQCVLLLVSYVAGIFRCCWNHSLLQRSCDWWHRPWSSASDMLLLASYCIARGFFCDCIINNLNVSNNLDVSKIFDVNKNIRHRQPLVTSTTHNLRNNSQCQ